MIQIPGPSMGINEIIDAGTSLIIAENKDDNKYNPLRPSSAGKCERELAYEYAQFKGYVKHETESKTPEVHRLLNLGGNIEYHANEEARRAFAKLDANIQMRYKQQTVSVCRLHDGTMIEGKIDLWLEHSSWRGIADWKSKSDKYSMYYKSSWDEFVEQLLVTGFARPFGNGAVFIEDLEKFIASFKNSFFIENIEQLNLYACTEFCKERNVNFCSILQYNKNDSRIREVRFVPAQNVADKVIAKFQKVAKDVEMGKEHNISEKQYVLGSQKCGFCSFKKQCWPEDDALKAYFKTYPPKQWAKDLNRLSKTAQEQLPPLFAEYHELLDRAGRTEQVELKIVEVLDKAKVFKVRLEDGLVYQVKRLKSGGPKDGERMVLRRSKS